MNERAKPKLKDGETLEDYIESMTDENVDARGGNTVSPPKGCDAVLKPGDSPTFMTMLLFHRGFCEYAFNDNFSFLLRNDPYLGHGTFGQLARFMPERSYIMFKQITELENGGWKTKPQFAKYLHALKGVPEVSEHAADRAFFLDLPVKFLKVYKNNLYKHILERWRSDKLIGYTLGGQPELAKQFAATLVNHKENVQGTINEDGDGEPINQANFPSHSYPNIEIEMDGIHTINKKSVKVNVKECMEFIVTENTDLDKVLKDELIEKNYPLIMSLGSAEGTVRIFDELDNGEFNLICITLI